MKPRESIPFDWLWQVIRPVMICHDQEPLDYNLYSPQEFLDKMRWFDIDSLKQELIKSHLRGATAVPFNAYDKWLLCHSEANSSELEKYQNNNFIGVYWWSHALIARDWYRYAEVDKDLRPDLTKIKYDFVVYNRAWSGSREYRLKFTELIVENNLQTVSNMKFAPVDSEVHYSNHQFKNPQLQVLRQDLASHFEINTSTATASADYSATDYAQSAIEVVLETLFDDMRWHLTEKILRPIACGRPFILASTPGSLEFLKRYGFRTFEPLINESYDRIQNPMDRLNAIVSEMKRISQLPTPGKLNLWSQLYQIAKYNQDRFFSHSWCQDILQEFADNMNAGIDSMLEHRKGSWHKIFKEHELRHPVEQKIWTEHHGAMHPPKISRTLQDLEWYEQWLKTPLTHVPRCCL